MVFLLTKETLAQPNISTEKAIQTALIANGFENVAVCVDTNVDINRVIVTYENRIYRHEIRAFQKILVIVSPFINNPTHLVVIPQNRGISLVALELDLNMSQVIIHEKETSENISYSNIKVSLDVGSYLKSINNLPTLNSSTMKFDIIVHPQFRALFGNYANPIRTQINLAPMLSTSLWKGMSLSAQWILPIQDKLNDEGKYGEPGLLTLNQTARLPYNAFVSATAGHFTDQRYGIDVEVKKFWGNGKWAIGADIGYTGLASYFNNIWYYSDIDIWTWFLSGEYRFSKLDLIVKSMYGLFLYQDKGWRFDVIRQFGEVDIGIFFLKTNYGHNGGFTFSIPIFPSKYMPTIPLRISPSKEFPWEYRYKGLPNSGIQYKTGNDIDDFVKKLDPDFTKNQILDWKN
jgi:hypothetical protein